MEATLNGRPPSPRADEIGLGNSIAAQIAYEPSRLPSARAIAERFNVSADIAREARVLAAAHRDEDGDWHRVAAAKLTDAQRAEIRSRTSQSEGALAREYRVPAKVIKVVRLGR
jgi:hypothetical protein